MKQPQPSQYKKPIKKNNLLLESTKRGIKTAYTVFFTFYTSRTGFYCNAYNDYSKDDFFFYNYPAISSFLKPFKYEGPFKVIHLASKITINNDEFEHWKSLPLYKEQEFLTKLSNYLLTVNFCLYEALSFRLVHDIQQHTSSLKKEKKVIEKKETVGPADIVWGFIIPSHQDSWGGKNSTLFTTITQVRAVTIKKKKKLFITPPQKNGFIGLQKQVFCGPSSIKSWDKVDGNASITLKEHIFLEKPHDLKNFDLLAFFKTPTTNLDALNTQFTDLFLKQNLNLFQCYSSENVSSKHNTLFLSNKLTSIALFNFCYKTKL